MKPLFDAMKGFYIGWWFRMVATGRTGVGAGWTNLDMCGICKLNLNMTVMQCGKRFHKEMNLKMPIAHAVVLRRVGDGPAC